MRKRHMCLFVAIVLLLIAAGSTAFADKTVVNLWSFTTELRDMVDKFLEINPAFDAQYDVVCTVVSTIDGEYQPALDAALQAGGANAPDLYTAESAFVLRYTQGDMAGYAETYANLGIDVNAKLTAANIAQYTVDVGTNPSGNLVALAYQSTGGGMIYRRDIAIDVWGTDDPAVIATKTGPGWDKFLEAAAELKAKGYAILSGTGDLWPAIRTGGDNPWIVGGKLYIDPYRESYLDYAKILQDSGYTNDTHQWTDGWYADMRGDGTQPVFAFFGPAWLINYVMAGNADDTYGHWAVTTPPEGYFWGGTWLLANKDSSVKDAVRQIIEWITLDCSTTGLQYFWANGTMMVDSAKDTVASGTVMAMSDGASAFLGGQNMFDVFVPATAYATGDALTQYDDTINNLFSSEADAYKNGNKTRAQAIADFKQAVLDTLGISAMPTPDPGDANGDDSVDIMDLVVIVDYIVNGNAPASMAAADANGDGSVDIMDLVFIINLIVNPPVNSAPAANTVRIEVPFHSSAPITALELAYTLSPGLTFVNAECSGMVGAGGDTNAVFANVNGGVTSGTAVLEVALQNGVMANQSVNVTAVTGANTSGMRAVGTPMSYAVQVDASDFAILTQPIDATVSVGNTATFTVEATAPEPMTYQWYVNTNTGVGWLPVAGATENAYTTDAAVIGDDGFRYFCRVTASEPYLDSAIATLTVVASPTTGDASHPGWLLALALLACAGIICLRVHKSNKTVKRTE